MSAKDYREAARANLAGNWGKAAVMTIVFAIMTGLGGVVFNCLLPEEIASVFSIVYSILVGNIVIWSYGVSFYKKSAYGTELGAGRVFDGFSNYGKVLLLELLTTIFICLWSLLLIIPGIIKYFSYAMAPYILADNPGMNASDAIKESKKMMAGHKEELFFLNLSYIWWFLVCIITCGIALLWIHPYMQAAEGEFYKHLKAESATA